MKFCVITFRSVTPAQRGEGALKRAGLDCTLQRTPRWIQEQGCGYSLRLRYRDVTMAAEILRQKRIAYRKIYTLREDGGLEEMAL